jgi:hypothetical protein
VPGFVGIAPACYVGAQNVRGVVVSVERLLVFDHLEEFREADLATLVTVNLRDHVEDVSLAGLDVHLLQHELEFIVVDAATAVFVVLKERQPGAVDLALRELGGHVRLLQSVVEATEPVVLLAARASAGCRWRRRSTHESARRGNELATNTQYQLLQ